MSALLYKAWLETGARFLAGLTAVAIICIFYMEQHAGFVRMATRDFQTHNVSHSIYARLGVPEYGWYLWFNLYVYFLQPVWALFAVLLAFDGLTREEASGTVSFSLGLPVSRKRWLFTRLAVVLMESAALSLFAVLVVIVGSAVIHQTFSLGQMFLHAALMVAAGVYIIALANLCYTLFPGNYLSLLATLVLLGVPYFWVQRHVLPRIRPMDWQGAASHPEVYAQLMHRRLPWWRYFDLAHAMAGPWQLNLATTPWVTLLVIWTLTVLVLAATTVYGDRVDY
jgi:ABC-2 family transporter protein